MSTINQWWGSRAAAASAFLKTGNFTGFQQTSGSCLDSSYCALGYACIGGVCQKKSSPSTGGNPFPTPAPPPQGPITLPGGPCGGPGPTPPGQPPMGCASPTPDKPNTPGCTKPTCGQNWGGGGYGGDTDCCGTRTCRYTAFSIQCRCGNSPSFDVCNEWCDEYKKSTGEISPACRGKGTCDECTYCDNGQCKIVSGAPCHCAGGSSCPDGLQCTESGECVEKPFISCCYHTETCKCGATTTGKYCDYITESSGPKGICAAARTLALRRCKEDCSEEGDNDGTEGGCSNISYSQGIRCLASGNCEDGLPCPEGSSCTATGCVKNEETGELCFIYTQADYTNATDACCHVECNCHTDCGPDQSCVNGTCS